MLKAQNPEVWYIAAGYLLPAGIEAYLLHYAAELRAQGFDTRIYVFQPLPKEKHRFLLALEERGIPIESLYTLVAKRVKGRFCLRVLPWMAYTAIVKRQVPNGRHFYSWLQKREASRLLSTLIATGKPDIVHVKGRVIDEAWDVFPAERTIYQHTLMGNVDPSWDRSELEHFSHFLNRIARICVQGKSIAEVFAREYKVNRPIDVIPTMVPDECPRSEDGSRRTEDGVLRTTVRGRESMVVGRNPQNSDLGSRTSECRTGSALRFGILCRFTEQKGIKFILEALRMFREKHGEVHFLFAGMGPLEGMIREWIREQGEYRSSGVSEYGSGGDSNSQQPTTNNQRSGMNEAPSTKNQQQASQRMVDVKVVRVESALDVLKQMDVFVHPGLDDAMPVSIVEAMMCGLPCISTRVGAVPDLLRDGREGLLVETASAAAIFNAMDVFAQMSTEALQGFGQRSRNRYSKVCLPSVVGQQVAELYHSVVRTYSEGAAL